MDPSVLDNVLNLVERTAEASDSYGWLVLAGVIASTELVPLVPTQPLSLISGLIFGATKGGAVTLLGVTFAASVAFTLSRGPAGKTVRGLAMSLEGGEEESEGEDGGGLGFIKKIGDGVEDMSFGEQLVSVVLLRLSPVIPFSISNYLVGSTPIRFAPFICGTVIGMSPWCFLYAIAGQGARALLENNQSLTFDGLEHLAADKLSANSEILELLAVGTVFMLAVFLFTTVTRTRDSAAEREAVDE